MDYFAEKPFFVTLAVLLVLRIIAQRFLEQFKPGPYLIKTLWFIGISIFEYSVLKRKGWLPTYMGGELEVTNGSLFDIDDDEDIRLIYQLGFAFHLHNSIVEACIGAKLAFYIHHVTTIALIYSSGTKLWGRTGALVMLVHDIPDIFTSMTKLSIAFDTMVPAIAMGVCLLTSWVYFRLYLFGNIINHAYTSFDRPFEIRTFFLILLGALWLLHVYWFFLILNMFINFKRSGNVKDTSECEGRLETIRRAETLGGPGQLKRYPSKKPKPRKDE